MFKSEEAYKTFELLQKSPLRVILKNVGFSGVTMSQDYLGSQKTNNTFSLNIVFGDGSEIRAEGVAQDIKILPDSNSAEFIKEEK